VPYVGRWPYGTCWQLGGQDVNRQGVNVPQEKKDKGKLKIKPCRPSTYRMLLKYVQHEYKGSREKDMGHVVDIKPFRCPMNLYCCCLLWQEGCKHQDQEGRL